MTFRPTVTRVPIFVSELCDSLLANQVLANHIASVTPKHKLPQVGSPFLAMTHGAECPVAHSTLMPGMPLLFLPIQILFYLNPELNSNPISSISLLGPHCSPLASSSSRIL